MNLLIIYLLGACLSGFIFKICMCIKSFQKYMDDSINVAKNEIKNDETYNLQETTIIENIDNNTLINEFNIIIVLLSWIGLLIVIFYILGWLITKIKN